jgi:rfaE bifunctional protein nucleotidyltransferase chain/domain
MTSRDKILGPAELKRRLTALRRQGKVVAFTNGCFDILHSGHVRYLETAKENNTVLIVGLNSDASVRKIKGPQRPIVPQADRAVVLAALACVDFVVIFYEETPLELIRQLKPDVLIKGADWKGKKIAGSEVAVSYGGKVRLIKYTANRSSTNIIRKIRDQALLAPGESA